MPEARECLDARILESGLMPESYRMAWCQKLESGLMPEAREWLDARSSAVLEFKAV